MAWSKGNTMLVALGMVSVGAIVFLDYDKKRNIVKVSKAFIGQMEQSGNSGFRNEEMERLMKEVGWQSGDAWCVYFAKLMWFLNAPEWLKPKIRQAISGSSQQTWANVNNDPAFVVSKVPKIGDIAIWQNYKDGKGLSTGHAGIVIGVYINDFKTVDGNTNASGSSEGYEVAEKRRPYNYDSKSGLVLKGFVRFA